LRSLTKIFSGFFFEKIQENFSHTLGHASHERLGVPEIVIQNLTDLRYNKLL